MSPGRTFMRQGSAWPGRFFLVLCLLLLVPWVNGQSDTTVEGPVTVIQCETGARCVGGDDCHNGICENPCAGRTNPFCECDCDIVAGGGDATVWIVIVGVGGVAVVGAAVALRRRPKAEKKDDRDRKKEESPLFILQLSRDHVTIDPDTPGELTVTVWKKVGDGPLLHAPEAAIRIAVPPAAAAGLKVIPAAGQGMITAAIRLEGSIQAGEYSLTVTASAGGSAQAATVIVTIEQDYVMEFF
jgi:hypothetical protein